MQFYHTPRWLKDIWPALTWDKPGHPDTVYITFDDGPTTGCTRWILDQLSQYNAFGTFFCVGQNAERHPGLLEEIQSAGHRLGNHTHHHLSGWTTSSRVYLENVRECNRFVPSRLFRPPYGRITPGQANGLLKAGYEVVMWSVLTYDFAPGIGAGRILKKILHHTTGGSIVVFHDNDKAFRNLREVLPSYLDHLSAEGYKFAAL